MLLSNLSIGYAKHTVHTGINAALPEGKLACLLGGNGAGKSTLLRTICGFIPPLDGSILFNHAELKTPISDAASLSPREMARLLSVVLTERIDIKSMTGRELIAMGRTPYTNFWGSLTATDKAIIDQCIENCHIEQLALRHVETLSDGERQKVLIAKALAQQTPYILLDEPTAFLDFPSKVDTMMLLRRIAHEENKSILVSTHDLDMALQCADQLWLMTQADEPQVEDDHEPCCFKVGTPKELASDGTLTHFFRSPHLHFDPEALRFYVKAQV
ncbi:MAG: ABC transporter ATP-binding protein [Bacteroidales bacterium]|nr:ABC transporter ATP-binding protein [Candidatus Physcousia equi]